MADEGERGKGEVDGGCGGIRWWRCGIVLLQMVLSNLMLSAGAYNKY